MSEIDGVMERFAYAADAAVVELGSQIYVSVGDQVVADVAFGTDGAANALDPAVMLAQYCALKPVVAVGLVQELTEAELHMPVGEFVEGLNGGLAEVSVVALLSHQASLGEPSGQRYRTTGAADRLRVIQRSHDVMTRRAGSANAAMYSESAAWHLAGLVLEEAGSGPLHEQFSRSHLFAGVEEWELCPPSSEQRQAIGIGAAFTRHGWMPRLAERSEQTRSDWSPGFGGFASTRAMGRMYEVLKDPNNAEVVRRLTQPERVGRLDIAMQRRCDFGRGVMVNLTGHDFGEAVSPSAFGHSGYGGQSYAFVDPERDLVVAVSTVGCSDPDLAVSIRRPQTIDEIIRSLGL